MSHSGSDFRFKIIAGKFKGKILSLSDKNVTRSTKNITRESVFNTLQGEVIGSFFVEVFGGSGTIGIEALSRGASEVVFMERDKNSYETIKSNLASLGVENGKVFNVDSFNFFEDILNTLPKEKRRIFYFDPPFDIREGMSGIYEKCIKLVEKIKSTPLDIVIFEHISTFVPPASISGFSLAKTKKFGKTSISYYAV